MNNQQREFIQRTFSKVISQKLSPKGMKEMTLFSAWIEPMAVSFNAYFEEFQKIKVTEADLIDLIDNWDELPIGFQKAMIYEATKHSRSVMARQKKVKQALDLLLNEWDNEPEENREAALDRAEELQK